MKIEEMTEEELQAGLEAILAQAQKEALQRAEAEGITPKEYDFPEGYDSNKYTWRQTTADRNLYFLEVIKNFLNYTCFKGLTIKDTEYLVSKGYTVDGLIDMIIENGVGNVYELNIW